MIQNRLKVLYYTPFYSGKCYPMFARMHDIWHYMNRMEEPIFDYEILASDGEALDTNRVEIVFDKSRKLIEKSESFRRIMERIFLPKKIAKKDFTIFHSIYFDGVTVKILKKLKKKKNVKTVVGPNIIGYFKQRKGDRYDLDKMSFLERMKSKRRYNLMKRYLSSELVDKVFSVGKYHTQLFEEVGVPKGKIYPIPPAVDPKYFGGKDNPNKNSDIFKILYVGNFSKFKGIDVFLRALEFLKKETDIDFKGIVMGKGNYPINDHSSIKENLEVVGYVDRADISRYYNEADVYVHPSIDEVGAGTMIESFACGTPVIASDRLGFKEYDTQNIAKFFELRTPEDLKDKLIEFYHDDRKGFDNTEFLIDEENIHHLMKMYKGI